MSALLLVLNPVLVVVTFLPLWSNPHWLVRFFDFPRLQIAVLGWIIFVLDLVWLDLTQPLWAVLTAGTAIALLRLAWNILPYTPFYPVEVASDDEKDSRAELSIITCNVLMHNRDSSKLLELVMQYRPDILVTLESDQWWQDQLDSLETDMPYSIKKPLDNLYGMHVYSRLPLENTQVNYLVDDETPSMCATVILRNGQQVHLDFVHPKPPAPTESEKSTKRDLELVLVGNKARERKLPVIVTGDLNDVAWSPTTRLFRKRSGLLDPRIGRGFFNTFHAKYSCIRWPLDHMFMSHHFTVSLLKRLPWIGSDHFALFARLHCNGDATEPVDTGKSAMQADPEIPQPSPMLSQGGDRHVRPA